MTPAREFHPSLERLEPILAQSPQLASAAKIAPATPGIVFPEAKTPLVRIDAQSETLTKPSRDPDFLTEHVRYEALAVLSGRTEDERRRQAAEHAHLSVTMPDVEQDPAVIDAAIQ